MFFPHVSAHRLDARPEKNGKKGKKLNMQKISESEKPRQMRARFLRHDCKKRKIGEVGQICKNERCKMRERPTPQRPAKEAPHARLAQRQLRYAELGGGSGKMQQFRLS